MEALEVVRTYLEAHNAHNIEQAVSLLSDDIRFETVGVWVRQGQHKVRELEEWDAALSGSLVFTGLAAEGNQVTCRVAERNEWFHLAGIGEVRYDSCVFTLHDGKIAAIQAKLAPESLTAIEKALGCILEWARVHKSDVLARLMPAGEFVYGRESAQVWLALWQEWRTGIP